MYHKKKVGKMQASSELTAPVKHSKNADHTIIKIKNPNLTKIEKVPKLAHLESRTKKVNIDLKPDPIKPSKSTM